MVSFSSPSPASETSTPEPPAAESCTSPASFGMMRARSVGVRDANLDAARVDADAAGNADLLLTQQASQIVAQIAGHAADHVGAIHFIEKMRAALQIEAQHDGIRL